jgi:TolA-binding protein
VRNRLAIALAVGLVALLLGLLLGFGTAAPSQDRLDALEAENGALESENVDYLDANERLQEEITDLEDQIGSLESRVDEIDERQVELDQRETALDTREQDLEDLQAELDERAKELDRTEEAIEENTIPGDGIWVVGEEIDPGTYKAQGTGSGCYWARLGSLDTSDILNNHFGSAEVSVQIHDSDAAFETSGCGSWMKQ